jgi:DNA-binding transcriptional ArsR family regulator
VTDDIDHSPPKRTLRDPRELRAMAHPVRIRIMDELFIAGALTASQLSDRIGESPANCSWHLRQLAKYGYVEEAGGGTGRQRPWRPVIETRSWGERSEGELAAAGAAMADLMYRHEFAEHEEYRRREDSEPQDWYDAAYWSQSFAWLTAAELTELKETIVELVLRYAERFTDPATRPADARAVRLVSWGFPARPWSEDRK